MSDNAEALAELVDRLLNAIRAHEAIIDFNDGSAPEDTDADLYSIADDVEENLEELCL